MNGLPSMAALVALLWCFEASPGWAVSPEEERLLGCGCEDAGLREDLPFTRRYSTTGVVRGSLAAAATEGGVPAAALVEALDALAAGIDLERELRDGDRFYVRYERSFTAAGVPIGIGRVLWAELDTQAKGKVSIHRYRPRPSTSDRFWLSTGATTATPRIRLPLENAVVSSGFGMRVDPFEQPSSSGAPRLPATFPIPNPRAVTKPPVAAPQATAGPAGGPQTQPKRPILRPTLSGTPTPLGLKMGLAPRAPGARSSSGTSMAMHEGVDLVAEMGTPVRAAGDGVVRGAEPKGGYGNWIEIEHAPGAKAPELATVYGHLSAFAPGIVPGAQVKQGDVIGFVGSTGRSTGPHLHFEILTNGKPTNPMNSPALRREQLSGDELLHFKKQVDRDLQEREREAGST
ncbi:M23 family metallopeptidase [Reyranella sp.]|uniref:M23 family metallopeptidase n=1 Tax=Reyranella sp. TaxID=1929291 RepID=UPI003D13C92E